MLMLIFRYHHGEASLFSTMINMAQTFVGSNNINLLLPSGQFGTRLLGGDDAASPRYLFTKLTDITTAIFKQDDDQVFLLLPSFLYFFYERYLF